MSLTSYIAQTAAQQVQSRFNNPMPSELFNSTTETFGKGKFQV